MGFSFDFLKSALILKFSITFYLHCADKNKLPSKGLIDFSLFVVLIGCILRFLRYKYLNNMVLRLIN